MYNEIQLYIILERDCVSMEERRKSKRTELRSKLLVKRLDNGKFDEVNVEVDNVSKTDKLENANVILVIPFGVPCANQAEDIVCELQRRNCHIAGAVLTNCNYKWVKAYYNKFSTVRGK